MTEIQNAQTCGCDPRINYKCEGHRDGKRCILGHWNRMDNCPACAVLWPEEGEGEENA